MKTTTHAARMSRILGRSLRPLATVMLLAGTLAALGTAHAVPIALPSIEQTDARLRYTGTWSTWSNSALSGASYAYASGADAGVTVAVDGGTTIELVTRTGPEFGIASITVDDGPPQDVDLYTSDNRYQQPFAVALPGSGGHTVRIEWTGRKNAAARSSYVGVDAIRTDGTIVAAPVRFEQSTACFAYAGTWGTWANPALSGGSYAFTNTPGSSVAIAFEGTGIALTARTGPEFGIAEVYIDGTYQKTIDMYSEVTSYRRRLYVSSSLSAGPHTLEVRWTGDKNAAASGANVCVDAVDVFTALPPAIEGATRREEADPRVAYAGTWAGWGNSALSGGAYRYANSAGSRATFSFEGTRLDLVTRTGPEFGIAAVSVDGRTPFLVDLYAPTSAFQQVVASTGVLPAGLHTVTVSWTGLRNGVARGTYIGIDAADIAVATVPPMAAGTLVEQTDAHVSFAGVWSTWSNAALSGGSYRYATGAGSEAGVAFTGTRLDIIGRTGPEFGVVSVTIDDGTPFLVDLYSPTTALQARVFSTWDLPSGAHTVRMRWTGLKNPASVGTYLSLDAVRVAGALTSTPVEDVDYRIWKTGAWGTWSNAVLSGGSYIYSNTPGSYADIAFYGTKLDLVVRKGPEFGVALVSVDGGAPVPVDLYSAQSSYRQTVITAGALANSRHTVRVSYSGAKNPAAIGTYVNLDAVATDGTLDQFTTRYEETHPWIMYGGSWASFVQAGLSGGSHRFTNVTGSGLSVSFSGRRFRLIARTGPELGIASVSLDGVSLGTVDLYSATYANQQIVVDTDDLVPGSHIISVQCTGQKNPASSGTYIAVDAIDIAGSLEQPPDTFTIVGQGWGHSIGLSQWGAKGYAEAGSSYVEILAWYYQGTSIGTPADPGLVTVNLQKNRAAKPSWVLRTGYPDRPTYAYDVVTGTLQQFGQIGGVYIIEPHPVYPTGTIVRQAVWNGAGWVANTSAPAAHFIGSVLLASPTGEFYSTSIVELETNSGPFDRTNVRWRGAIEFKGSQVTGLKAVNQVPMDHYLYGVVPRESPASWHIEALKAQAVAARSYAYKSVVAGNELYCTTNSQMYGGHSRGAEMYEEIRSNQAVDQTSSQYVMYGSEVVQAFFSSSSGGHTANVEDVWVSSPPKPYFRGVYDPYGVGSQWGPHVYSPAALAAKLGHGGAVVRLAPEYVASGHVKWITITYSDGTSSRITGDSFRLKLGLNSTHFQATQR